MRQRLRFYSDVIAIAVGGGAVGFFIAKGHWSVTLPMFFILPLSIYRMWDQYRPDAAERRAMEARRREAERAYEHQERWRPGPAS